MNESILTTTKKLLGLDETNEEFDTDIIANINSAIFSLFQLGIGPSCGYRVTNKDQTFLDYLPNEDDYMRSEVSMYVFLKTKVGFDNQMSSASLEAYKEQIREAEWRIVNHHIFHATVGMGCIR